MAQPADDHATRGAPRSSRPLWFEISDALWLAGHMAAASTAEDVPGPSARSPADPEVSRDTGVGKPHPGGRTEENTAANGNLGSEFTAPVARAPSIATSGQADGDAIRTGRPVRGPNGDPFAGVSPLPDRRRIEQALRPFRRPTPTPHREPVLDDEATADRAAQDELWLPETRPATERWLDLDIVLDDGPLAMFTRPLAAAFTACLSRVGVFRTVHIHLLDTTVNGNGTPVLREVGPLAAAKPADGLVGRAPPPRRLVIVLTDGVGTAWHSGTAQRLLSGWGRQVPLVIVNLLTRRQWRRTGLATRAARLHGAAPAAANRHYRVRCPTAPTNGALPLQEEPDPSVVHVPVIELDPDQLAAWTRFVTARGGDWYGAVMTSDAPAPHRLVDETGPALSPTPSELVRRFQAAVSPTVHALAVHLAAAPLLNTPIMRLVQGTMLPASRPSDLTELVGSGLLRRIGPDRRGLEAPDEATFDFVPGVREQLLAGGRRSDTARVLLTVTRNLEGRAQGMRELATLITDPEHAVLPNLDERLLPFAVPTLRALAGPYLRAADAAQSQNKNSLSPATSSQETGQGPARKDPMYTLDSFAANGHVEIPDAETQDPPLTFPLGVGVTIRAIPPAAGRDPSDPPPVWGNVPPRNINFTGREDLLQRLHERLSHGTTAVLPQALHGMGGVGKSQIAIEYVYRHEPEYDLIWWVRAERPGQIQQDLTELAAALDLPVSQEANVAVPAVREALRLGRPYRNWLLVFDNAEELRDVQRFFPTNGPGKILVTSRNQNWTEVAQALEVDVFARAESIELLSLRGPQLADAEADEVADLLGDLPLAIAQAAVWLSETGMTVGEYLHLFKEKHDKAAELLRDTAPAYELPVAAAWNVSLDRLRTSETAALQLLQVCAFFAPEPIPLRLLSAARNIDGPPELLAALSDPIRLGRTIRAISQYALARISHKHNTLLLHRLVQRVLVSQIDPADSALLRRCGHQLMANYDPDDAMLPTNWQRYNNLLPHILDSGAVRSDDTWVRHLVLNEIDFLYRWGDHRGFLELAENAVQTWTERLGGDHEQTLAAGLRYGRALRLAGRFREAYEHHSSVLEIQTAAHGADDERALEALQYVAADLRYLGQFGQSLEYDKRAYETVRRMYGTEDPVTLQQAHLYAISLRLNGDFWAARDLDRETHHHHLTIYGESHAKTLSSLAAIAVDEMECGDYDAARELTRQNVQLMEAAFGNSYAGLAENLSAFSVMERKAGNHERALEVSTDALERHLARYGPIHPGTISATLNHAVNLRQTGRLTESIQLARESARSFLEMFGTDHPDTASADINLAVALRANGQAEEARKLDEAALDALTRVLGLDHPRTIICSINLASDHYALEKYQQAAERDRVTLDRAHRVLGESHPIALACEYNLAMDLGAVDDAQADRRLSQAIEKLRNLHGAKHPATISAQQGFRADCDIYPIPV